MLCPMGVTCLLEIHALWKYHISTNAMCGKKYFHKRTQQVTKQIRYGVTCINVCKNEVVIQQCYMLLSHYYIVCMYCFVIIICMHIHMYIHMYTYERTYVPPVSFLSWSIALRAP